MITPAQQRLLIHLDAGLSTGICPSVEELRVQLGYGSKSTVSNMLDALKRAGYVRSIPGRNRSLEVIRRPGEQPCAIYQGQPLRFVPILPAHGSLPERAGF